MKRYFATLLIAVYLVTLPSFTQQKTAPCTVTFSLAERDTLGNVNVGFSPDGQKWFDQKVGKRYPNVCYSDQKINAGIWLYILDSFPPNTINHLVYTLKIVNNHDGNTDVLRTFQCPSLDTRACRISGRVAAIIHPERAAILDAIDWLSKADLTSGTARQPN